MWKNWAAFPFEFKVIYMNKSAPSFLLDDIRLCMWKVSDQSAPSAIVLKIEFVWFFCFIIKTNLDSNICFVLTVRSHQLSCRSISNTQIHKRVKHFFGDNYIYSSITKAFKDQLNRIPFKIYFRTANKSGDWIEHKAIHRFHLEPDFLWYSKVTRSLLYRSDGVSQKQTQNHLHLVRIVIFEAIFLCV